MSDAERAQLRNVLAEMDLRSLVARHAPRDPVCELLARVNARALESLAARRGTLSWDGEKREEMQAEAGKAGK